MNAGPAADNQPFRWDLMTPDQLGNLLEGCAEPDLWFLDEMVACAAKVLARSGNGRLLFVGRSAGSIFDLLSGALADTAWRDRPHRIPFSFRGDTDDLTPYEIRQARNIFAAAGLSPDQLARAPHPATFVDLVYAGHTFTNLYRLRRDWVDEQRQPWNVVRSRIRFVGITGRTKTSPNTWRWHQHADWTRHLPARSIVNISIDRFVWHYLGDHQTKLTRSFHPRMWTQPDGDGPLHDDKTRQALAEAVALVEYGRTAQARRTLARIATSEPAMAEAWLRTLITQLRVVPDHGRQSSTSAHQTSRWVHLRRQRLRQTLRRYPWPGQNSTVTSFGSAFATPVTSSPTAGSTTQTPRRLASPGWTTYPGQ